MSKAQMIALMAAALFEQEPGTTREDARQRAVEEAQKLWEEVCRVES